MSSSDTSSDPLRKDAPQKERKRHGARNTHKMKFFIRWLEETFPHAFADKDGEHHILDVAGGGKGELATRLAWCHQLKVVIVDPRQTNVTQCFEKTVLPQLPKKWQQRARERSDISSVLDSRVSQLQIYFTQQNAVENVDDSESGLLSAIQNATLFIGMHADGAVEAIVDSAVHFSKPFVVVPCCVFPNLFHKRTITKQVKNENGITETKTVPVRSYEDFCQYLLDKDQRFRSTELPFPGRNLAIWWDGI